MILCIRDFFEIEDAQNIWLLPGELYYLHLYIRKLVLLGAAKENASELHRSAAAALNSKDNNGIGNIYRELSRFFSAKHSHSAK